MTITETDNSSEKSGFWGAWAAVCCWASVALMPLLVILVSFVIGVWSWGLMDDYTILSRPGNMLERTAGFFNDMLLAGRFRPSFDLYSGVVYKIFEHSPQWFFIFRWALGCATLVIWGYLAYLLTRRKIAIALVPCVALSFYKLYDAFFYLSSQEMPGMFFAGLAGILLFRAFEQLIAGTGRVRVASLIGAGVFFLAAFGFKETFIAVSLAWGIALILLGVGVKAGRTMIVPGLLLTVFSLAYGVLLKIFIVKEYTAAYSLTDMNNLLTNIRLWFRHDLLAHAPWILAAGLVVMIRRKNKVPAEAGHRWGILLAVLFYVSYVLVLIPWSTTGHYATPLGIFFAFIVAVLIAGHLEHMPALPSLSLAGAALVLNLVVSGMALQFASRYQEDTANLLKWMAGNIQFVYETNNGAGVRANAMEPGDALPNLVKFYYDKTIPRFVFTPRVRDIVMDRGSLYYLYGPTWGDQDLSRPEMLRAGQIWSPVFVSKSWIMFRRMN